MKKEYEKPFAEVVSFEPAESIMTSLPTAGGEIPDDLEPSASVEEW